MKLSHILTTLIIILGAWYFLSPLFTNTVVDEVFPEVTQQELQRDIEMFEELMPEDVDNMPTEEQEELKAQMEAVGMQMEDEVVEDEMDVKGTEGTNGTEDNSVAPRLLRSGIFKGFDALHQGEGSALLFKLIDTSLLLRFEDFSVTNGPALYVYLTKSADGSLEEGYLDLGKLKGNKGNQNYEIPSGTNLDEYNSVLIYCRPFRVKFAVAPLQ